MLKLWQDKNVNEGGGEGKKEIEKEREKKRKKKKHTSIHKIQGERKNKSWKNQTGKFETFV